ncbi:MAG: type II toxin-antitoxin system VapC family toxin [Patescibacteria group bacterium]
MISYDANVLIYAFESDTKWSGQSRRIVSSGEQETAALSVLIKQEVLTGAALQGKAVARKMRDILQHFENTKFVPVTLAIVERAVELTAKYGRQLKGYDAIHLAAAIEHGATVFYTNDQTMLELGVTEIVVKSLE